MSDLLHPTSEFITLVSIVVGFVLAVVVSVLGYRASVNVSNRQGAANAIFASRLKWIDDLRSVISELVSLYRRWSDAKDDPISEDDRMRRIAREGEVRVRIYELRARAELLLNPEPGADDRNHKSLIDLLADETLYGNRWSVQREKMRPIVEITASILKDEWKKAKKELKTGKADP